MSKVEIREDQRQALERIARRRGECDVSGLVQEALDQFLSDDSGPEEDEQERLARIRALRGSITDEDADEMQRIVRELREDWR